MDDVRIAQAREAASKDAPINFEITILHDMVMLDDKPLIQAEQLCEAIQEWLIYLLLPQSRRLGLTFFQHRNQ